jgi:hypothetical protein
VRLEYGLGSGGDGVVFLGRRGVVGGGVGGGGVEAVGEDVKNWGWGFGRLRSQDLEL